MTTQNVTERRSNRSLLRRWAIDLLRIKPLGCTAAYLSGLAGQAEISRKISTLCQFVPPTVEIVPPDCVASGRRFSMGGARGLDNVARSLWWGGGWKAYEPPFPDLFAACSLESRLVLDIGAYSGLYSLIAATCCQRARVYAFEPYPPVRALLEANLRRNRLEDRVTIVPVALSDRSGLAPLFVPPTTTGMLESASSLNSRRYIRPLERFEVPVTTLDAFVEERSIGAVDLIKMDVETHEPEVLHGAGRLLRGGRPTIFLEILSTADTTELEATRAELDYLDGLLVDGEVRVLGEVKFSGESHNHVMFPAERREWLSERADLVGCRLVAGA